MLYVWVILYVICAHVIVPRPDSFRSEWLWEIRVGWLSVRTLWGPSKHLPGQMSLLVCLDSETWLWQMHKPLKGCFSSATPSGACQDLGHWQMCEESHWKHGSFILSTADNSQMLTTGHKEPLTPRPLVLTKLCCDLSCFALTKKREREREWEKTKTNKTAIYVCHTDTHARKSNTNTVASCFCCGVSCFSTVASAQFHFSSLHHATLSQPPCNVNVGKLFKTVLSVWVVTLLFTFPCSVNWSFGIDTNNFCTRSIVKQSICFQSASWGFISPADDRLGVGVSTKEKNNLALAPCNNLVF